MSIKHQASTPAGWYDDPYNVNQLRWFDGTNWTDRWMPKQGTLPAATEGTTPTIPSPRTAPTPPLSPEPPKKKHTGRNVFITLVLVFVGIPVLLTVVWAVGGGNDTATAPPEQTQSQTQPAAPEKSQPTAPEKSQPAAPEKSSEPKQDKSTPPKPKPAPEPQVTLSQQMAMESAESYLEFEAFSRTGLIQQLSSKYGEGFSKADAIYAVDHIKVDWYEQAARSAKSYLEMQPFSRTGLIQQLSSKYGEGFTHDQAVYGVTQAGL
jgi:hypothetical protein